MTPELLQIALERALACTAIARGYDGDRSSGLTLRRPKSRNRGDWTSNIALRSAELLDTDPLRLAEEIAGILRLNTAVAAVEVSGPGFLNITVSPGSLAQIALEIVAAGDTFGPDDNDAAEIDAIITERIASTPTIRRLEHHVGTDALRFTAARAAFTAGRGTKGPSHPVESGLLRRADRANPVYCIQSAHAAARRIERCAVSAGIGVEEFDPLTLDDDTETALLGALAEFHGTVERAVSSGEPRRIAHHLVAVSDLFFVWSDTCTVTPTIDESITPTHGSRLVLDRATIMVLATGLQLLGVCAPERM